MPTSKPARTAYDTNVLVYALNTDSPFHIAALRRIRRLGHITPKIVISTQNLTEFYAIVTNPKVLAHPLTPNQAYAKLKSITSSGVFDIVYPNPIGLKLFIQLTQRLKPTAQQIHDVFLISTLLGNGVSSIVSEDKLFPKSDLVVEQI